MTEAQFNAATRGIAPPPAIIADNNPAPNIILSGAGITLATSNEGKIFIWDGGEAIYLEVKEEIGLSIKYRLVQCTQDATEFAALLND